MKKTTTFYSRMVKYLWDISDKTNGDTTIELKLALLRSLVRFYHNALIIHLVKKLPNPRKTVKLYRLRFDEMDTMRKEIEFARVDRSDTGFNEALDQVREMLNEEKVS